MNLTKLADWINANWYSAHRAAVKVGGHYVLFGNDGVGDPTVTVELSLVLRRLRDRKHRVVGLATDAEFFTWVLVVRPGRGTSEDKLTNMLFDCWMEAVRVEKPHLKGNDDLYQALQTAIAIETVATRPLPRSVVKWLKSTAFRGPKVTS